MTKFIGPQFSIGIGKESVRATAVAAAYWLPWSSLTVDDKIKAAMDETSIGVIEHGIGQEITMFTSECQLESNIDDSGFGLILMSTFGTDTVGAVETGVKDHVFTVAQSAQHPSLSISVAGPNESTGLVYALGMMKTLDLNFELDKYATYKASLGANKNASQANTASFSAVNRFRPQDMTFGYATAYSGLNSPTAVGIKKFTISIKKNTEDDEVLGNTSPIDRLNKGFEVEGSFELYYTDRTMIDTIMMGDLQKALIFTVVNANVTIGAVSHPSLTIKLAKVKLTEVARKLSAKDITMQTIKFKAFYSMSDSLMLNMTLRNTVTASY